MEDSDDVARFRWSDGWLLCSIGGKRCDRAQLIRNGDTFNHAIFLDEEIDGGILRLEAAGFASFDGMYYRVRPAGRRFLQKHFPTRTGHIEAMFVVCEALMRVVLPPPRIDPGPPDLPAG